MLLLQGGHPPVPPCKPPWPAQIMSYKTLCKSIFWYFTENKTRDFTRIMSIWDIIANNVANWLIATLLPIMSQINIILLKSQVLFSCKISKDSLLHNVACNFIYVKFKMLLFSISRKRHKIIISERHHVKKVSRYY